MSSTESPWQALSGLFLQWQVSLQGQSGTQGLRVGRTFRNRLTRRSSRAENRVSHSDTPLSCEACEVLNVLRQHVGHEPSCF